ncbi:AraC family transcriptional regulator [Brevibacterium sp. GP-SGM9]|uniref:helix-turn-helix transcriptional regulator n=1 Tax=Brevibacterium sp. GP-SGM9 TaxID=3376990 RepID=UPI0039A46925
MPTIKPFRTRTDPDRATGSARVAERRLPRYEAGQLEMPVRILGSQEEMDRETYWAEHSHPTHELLWRDAGVGTVTIGSRTWTITAPLGMWIPAGIPHSGWTPAGVVVCAAQFSVDNSHVSDTPTTIAITPLLRLLLDRLQTLEAHTDSYSLTEAMILDVMSPAAHELLLHRPNNPLLDPIVAAIAEDPADETSLQDWAHRLGASARTITRAFEAETGLGFNRWVTTARIQHAVSLIGLGHAIEDAAFDVGYASTSAFTTAFKRITGTTPGQFRA